MNATTKAPGILHTNATECKSSCTFWETNPHFESKVKDINVSPLIICILCIYSYSYTLPTKRYVLE